MTMKTKLLSLSIAAAAVGLTACSDDPKGGNAQESSDEKKTYIELTPAQNGIGKQTPAFAWNFFDAVSDNVNENIVVSPLSMEYVLALAANGAAGTTQSEILAALGFDSNDLDNLNTYFKAISAGLPTKSANCTIQLANSIWSNQDYFDFEFRSDFTKNAADYFAAEAKKTNNNNYVADINAWCKESTSGMIPEFLPKDYDPRTFALINALYFNGKWSDKFKKEDTSDKIFHNADGTEASVAFMNQISTYLYDEIDDYQIVELPYGGKFFMNMYVILPKEDSDIESVITDIKAKEWWNATNMNPVEVTLSLPKFDLNYSLEEKDAESALRQIGINELFSESPDMSNLATTDVTGIEVLQRNIIKVDEEGAEAAAVTGMSGLSTSCPPSGKAAFVADRPFIFVVQEYSTNAILFIGKICKF